MTCVQRTTAIRTKRLQPHRLTENRETTIGISGLLDNIPQAPTGHNQPEAGNLPGQEHQSSRQHNNSPCRTVCGLSKREKPCTGGISLPTPRRLSLRRTEDMKKVENNLSWQMTMTLGVLQSRTSQSPLSCRSVALAHESRSSILVPWAFLGW